MFQILPLFPTPLYVAEIGIIDPTEMKVIETLETTMNVSGNSYSVNTKVLDMLPKLSNIILPHIKQYVDNVMCPETDVSLRITQSWINKNKIQQGHHKHNHDNSIISGVYYVCPETPPSILFHRKKESDISFDIKSHNPFNSKQYKVNVKRGMLILFPSSLDHSVDVNTISDQRITLAFNTFFTGIIGNDLALTKLELS
jgi:uncharacterized protein (TIGR02466 family)